MIGFKKYRAFANLPNIGFGLAMAVMVGSALLSYRNAQSVTEAAEARHRAFVRLDLLHDFLAALVDIETGARGFVVTGVPAFLEPYHSGMERLGPHLQRLRDAMAENLRMLPVLTELEETATLMRQRASQVVSLKSSRDLDAARRAVATGEGKKIMDHVRQLVATLGAEDREQLRLRDQEFQAGLRRRVHIIVFGSLFGFVVVVLAAVTLNRSLKERIRLNMELSQSLSENTQMLDRIRAAGVELTRSNQELEQFAYVASHDLQEPLRKVSSFAQLLATQYKGKLDADADEFIGYMVDGARRMQTLIQSLLAYSRLGRKSKPFAPVDGNAVLKQALANLQGAIEESGAVVASAALPTVLADEIQLVQLFQNLIGNAIKFHGAEKPLIQIRAEPNGTACTFSVRDNGIGIDQQFAERIFVIFQRLHNREEYPGTGIGLALCKKIVERHGGSIWLDSQPGQGAAFCFTLPQTIDTKQPTLEHA